LQIARRLASPRRGYSEIILTCELGLEGVVSNRAGSLSRSGSSRNCPDRRNSVVRLSQGEIFLD
jgi:hypothetical protein